MPESSRLPEPLQSMEEAFAPGADPAPLRRWARSLESENVESAADFVRALDILRQARRLKTPLPAAERLAGAVVALDRAQDLAMRRIESEVLTLIEQARSLLLPQCDAEILTRLDEFHEQKLAMLRRTTSGRRQHAIATQALQDLHRLSVDQLRPAAAAAFERILSFWQDQLSLVSCYAPTPRATARVRRRN